MNVPQEELNKWADLAWRANGPLLHVKTALLRSDLPSGVLDDLETARSLIVTLQRRLLRAGADDPGHADRVERYGEEIASEFVPKETPLALLSSPAAKRYAEAIRAAAQACQEMEQEREITDGLAEVLSDYADVAELETFGPKGL